MASFDIIKSVGSAYQLVWKERRYLVRLAAIPFLIKLVCYIVIVALGWEENFLRQAIIMLPSYFADGWLFCHLVRLIFLDHRWPFRPSGDTDKDMALLQDRAAGIMAGALTFTVIKFLLAGITFVIYEIGQTSLNAESQDVNPAVFFLMLGFLVFSFWGFRFLWLYIPAAINYPLKRFLHNLGGYTASWYLIGTWLLCFLPLFFIFGKFISIIGATVEGQTISIEVQFLAIFFHILLDTGVGLLATAAMAIGFKDQMFSNGKQKN
ncbi:MAG: hypothetical protein CO093_05360 [Alphaproteobacteria bacterium CG_4_9_14_3_um_filter_47_13]|nr:MAG: hypothetical protein CO093_05360 [Alphaproteobacteria bacterium CG_4_9_14_3_um_filter_47_13]